MSGYEPWVGKLDDGTEVLVTVQVLRGERGEPVKTVEVAFRGEWDRMWSPPVHLVRAP